MSDNPVEAGCSFISLLFTLLFTLVMATGAITLTILVVTALWFGLPVGDKRWNVDIFPPKVWDMTEEAY